MMPIRLLASIICLCSPFPQGTSDVPEDIPEELPDEAAAPGADAVQEILAPFSNTGERAYDALHLEYGAFEKWLEQLIGPDRPWLFDQGFLLRNWQWVGLLALVLFSILIERICVLLLFRSFRKLAGRERVKVDESHLRGLGRPLRLLLVAWFFGAFLPIIGLTAQQVGIERFLILGLDGIRTAAGVWAAWMLIEVGCDFLRAKALKSANKYDDMLVPLVRRVLKILVVVVGLVRVAVLLGSDIVGIVAGLSVGMVAIGLASKDSIENLIGTFTILLDKPFQLGDWITVGEVDGTVEAFGIRSTRVRTFYNSLISVPNRRFVNENIDNWGARSYRRIKLVLGLTYATPPEKVEAFCEGVRELIRTHPYTRKDYFHVYLQNLSESGLDVLVYTFVRVPDWATELRERHRLLADILRLAERLGVEFAYPTRTLHILRPGEGEEHPDRPAIDPEGTHMGRATARTLVADSQGHLAGEVPPPVDFEPPS